MPALLDVQGVGPIVAGILLAEVGNPKRFASANHFASIAEQLRSSEEAARTVGCKSILEGIAA